MSRQFFELFPGEKKEREKKEGSFEGETLVESFFRRALGKKISCGIEMGQGSRSFRSKEFRVESNWDK